MRSACILTCSFQPKVKSTNIKHQTKLSCHIYNHIYASFSFFFIHSHKTALVPHAKCVTISLSFTLNILCTHTGRHTVTPNTNVLHTVYRSYCNQNLRQWVQRLSIQGISLWVTQNWVKCAEWLSGFYLGTQREDKQLNSQRIEVLGSCEEPGLGPVLDDSSVELDERSDMAISCSSCSSLLWIRVEDISGGSSAATLTQRTGGQQL